MSVEERIAGLEAQIRDIWEVTHELRNAAERDRARISGLNGQVATNEDDIASLKESLESAWARIEKLEKRQPVAPTKFSSITAQTPQHDALYDPRDGSTFSTTYMFAAAKWCSAEAMEFTDASQTKIELPVWHKYRKADEPAPHKGWVIKAVSPTGGPALYYCLLYGAPSWTADKQQAFAMARREDACGAMVAFLSGMRDFTLAAEFMEFVA